MRVAAVGHVNQVADVDDGATVFRVRGQGPVGPGVVADAVLDDEVRRGEGAAVLWRRFVVVWVGVRVGDDGGGVHATAAELHEDAAPGVDGGDGVDGAARPCRRGAGAAGRHKGQG